MNTDSKSAAKILRWAMIGIMALLMSSADFPTGQRERQAGQKNGMGGYVSGAAFAMDMDKINKNDNIQNKDSISGTYILNLPMPGGDKKSELEIIQDGGKITGRMSRPGNPEDVYPVKTGSYKDGKFILSVDMNDIVYTIEGEKQNEKLLYEMTTVEEIELGEGSRVEGNKNEVTGLYQVPVYSPGGVKENFFELKADNGKITGEMYCLGGNDDMPGPPMQMGESGRDGMMPPGMDAQNPMMPGPGMEKDKGIPGKTEAGKDQPSEKADGGLQKRDVNAFYAGDYAGNRINLYTKTGQGSVFHFAGTIEGDKIKLVMSVTDHKDGLETVKTESK